MKGKLPSVVRITGCDQSLPATPEHMIHIFNITLNRKLMSTSLAEWIAGLGKPCGSKATISSHKPLLRPQLQTLMIPCFWDSYSIEELKWPPQQLPNANIWIGDAYKILKFAFRFAAVYSHAHGATNPDHRLCPVCSAMDCTVGTHQVSRVMSLLGISYKCIWTRPRPENYWSLSGYACP